MNIYLCCNVLHYSISCQGFIQRGGAWNSPPPPSHNFPPPEILKLSLVLSQALNNNFVPDCIRSNLRGSKIQNFSGRGGGGMLPDPPSRHTHIHVCECDFAHYHHHATTPFPPTPQLKILYETLYRLSGELDHRMGWHASHKYLRFL